MRMVSELHIAGAARRAARRGTASPRLDRHEWPGTDPRLTRIDRQLVYYDELHRAAFDRYRTFAHQSRDTVKGPATRARSVMRRKQIFRTLAHIAEMRLKLARQRYRLLIELGIVFH